MTPDGILPPGSTIGVLGGGQLGRMIALAAAPLGLKTHIYAHHADEPAAQVASAITTGEWTDEAALARFADAVDVVTYEFENVPAATAAFLAARKPVRPGPLALGRADRGVLGRGTRRDGGARIRHAVSRWRPPVARGAPGGRLAVLGAGLGGGGGLDRHSGLGAGRRGAVHLFPVLKEHPEARSQESE